ncbi:hypothetical protein [uncultured Meiothermus sp.]|uniref:hypothetical protein n=1 Tax=uncultured Meiothermus sp. TaxID=157471 RepID=UPI0026292CDC|nr:hypothetical protein [uncultured Meiothermus sp.]
MKVQRQEVAMVVAIVWIFSVVAQIQQLGFWPSLLFGLPVGLLAGAAYWFLMPRVIRWAARGVKPKPEDEEEAPALEENREQKPASSDEPDARP